MMKRTAFILSLILGLACASHGQVMMLFTADSLSYITSPLDIDSLVLWLRADAGVTDSLDGTIATDEGVGYWDDQSVSGKNVIQDTTGKRPVYKATGGPGGWPALQFDGTNDYLRSTANMNIVGNEARHVFIVGRVNTGDAYGTLISWGATSGDWNAWEMFGTYTISSTLKGLTIDVRSARSYYNNTSTVNIFRLWDCGFTEADDTASQIDLFEDGDVVTSINGADGSLNTTNSGFYIGTNRVKNAAGFMAGYISEVIVYDKELTAAEKAAVRNYLNKKYDLY